jgi:Putative adhesin
VATFVRTQAINHPVGERGQVTIKVTDADVRLQGVEGPEARLRATFEIRAGSEEEADRIFNAIQLRVRVGSGTLSVEEVDGAPSLGQVISRLFGGVGHIDLNVEADLPLGAELHLAGVSSDVEVTGMRGEQRYATVSGDLRLRDLGGSVRLNAVSGDITIRAAEPISVTADAVSGDLAITAPRLRSLRVSSVSGDVELEAELVKGGEFRVDTVSGDLGVGLVGSAIFEIRGLSTDVHSELDHRLEGRMDRRRLIVGQGGPIVVFSSMSGDVGVRAPRRLEARPAAPSKVSAASPDPDVQLEVLRALERGEIDVDEATRRLAGAPPDA